MVQSTGFSVSSELVPRVPGFESHPKGSIATLDISGTEYYSVFIGDSVELRLELKVGL